MRRITGLFITLLLISCGEENDPNNYTVNGTALGYDDGTPVYVYRVNEQNRTMIKDTVEVVNQKFEATYANESGPILHFFRLGESKGTVLFFAETEDLKATVYKDSIGSSFVQGGKQNELYYEYQAGIADIARRKATISEEYRQAQMEQDGILINELRQENNQLTVRESAFNREFVMNNGSSVFGLMLVSELYAKNELTSGEVTQILDGLGPKMADHKLAESIRSTVATKMKSEIGGKAPEFSGPTPTGETLALADAMGKYTIIDFWASWCKPCRRENPNVVNVYEKYHDKGLNIISVSLDRQGQKERWIQAIEDDKMDWHHISHLQFWQDPVAKQYNVKSIPATFLIDENGTIIDKNLRGPALGQRIASLLD